jgi:pimeloyl-ACP methyl ester carboxylesterase
MPLRFACATLLVVTTVARGDGPRDNIPDKVRPIPPVGIEVPAADREALQKGVAELGQQIERARGELAKKPALLALLPDVQIFHNAVRYALQYNEFSSKDQIKDAAGLLRQGRERLDQLCQGKTPWTSARGLVVRGFISKIDGSVQPYGLVVPDSYQPGFPQRYRLDIWCHGRGETLTEVAFLLDRQRSRGHFTPRNTLVLHPYGRYSNAFKFAGEIDVLEALEHVRRHYPIDDNRVVMRGFSMGGAACWQFAVHYPGKWAAAAPGAGFSETAEFLRVFQEEKLQPTWYERKLWHLYDCTDYALNLYNCPTVAYSGEKDRQKQAADMMQAALLKEGLHLVHIIGPGAGHGYEPKAKREVARRIDAIAERGRNPLPRRVRFTTWTLRYNQCSWVRLDALAKHWERASVDAEINPEGGVRLATKNVTALTLSMPPGSCPFDATRAPKVFVDGKWLKEKLLPVAPVLSDRSWTLHLRRPARGEWAVVDMIDGGKLGKRHGLQGPIDDAFLDSFVMVRPTGKALNDKVAGWTRTEMEHAVKHWRQQFRGEARVKDDSAVTAADIASSNLVLWGDPASNKILAKIADKLPLRWTAEEVRVGKEKFAAADHVPVMIYPNPLNPKRYVVLNSGFTYREYDYLNNARQVPKLPDFAVIDLKVPPTSQRPGGIATAGFFDERWQLPSEPAAPARDR